VCVCVCVEMSVRPSLFDPFPPSFYRLKEVGLHAWGLVRSSTSPPWSGGEQLVFPVAERCGA